MKKIGRLLLFILIGVLGGVGGGLYQDGKSKNEK